MEKLPKRLKAAASLIPPGKTVADIGTDHALMPMYLVQSGITSNVIATDINKGPFQRAKAVVRLQG
jgi:tRNA (adenine22-N1)-methyltransferase